MEPTSFHIQTEQSFRKHRFQSAFRDISGSADFRSEIDKTVSGHLGTSRKGLFFNPAVMQRMSFAQTPQSEAAGLNALTPKAGYITHEAKAVIEEPTEKSVIDSLPGGISHVLDTINPLHHLPVIGNVYRAISGDKITGFARMAGGALYGGTIGFAAATLNAVIEGQTGRDVAGHAMSALGAEELAHANRNPQTEMIKVSQAYQDTARYAHERQARYNS